MIALGQSNRGRKPTNARRTIPDIRLRFLAGKVHGLGPRPLFEMLRELDAGADLHLTLEAYARLPAAFIAAHGGDQLMPLRAVEVRRD
jgi:hypothetical protein